MDDLTNPVFHDADKARAYLEKLRWPNGPVCAHCGAPSSLIKPIEGKKQSHRKGLYYCNSCKGQFTVTNGTVLEQSHVPLNKWLMAFYLMCASKKGYSAHQLHRTIKVSYKTAWFMAHRIREAMRSGGLVSPIGGNGGVVEVDETIYGRASTHPKGRKFTDKRVTNSAHKNVILSLVERGGSVRSFHIAGSTTGQVLPIVKRNISKEAQIMTDSAQLYKYSLGDFASHDRVDHTKKEYARYEDGRPVITTNTVEGYFSVFKRGMRGTYQHCAERHLHRYLAEFDFRYNTRVKLGVDDTTRTETALLQIKGKRITYRRVNGAGPQNASA